MGTSLERQSYLTDMSARADGLGMKRWQFRGFDVVEVYENVKKAVEHARSGEGPVMLEAITYRYRGHSMSDPAKYRKTGELEERKKEDSIDLAIERLKETYGVTDEEIAEIQASIEAEAQEAYAFADESPEPDPQHLYDYVYASHAE
jgi:pyruvate dehydrogenase E1 component alpha subunit